MDSRCRRGRRGRCHSHSQPHSFVPPLQHRSGKAWNFFNSIYSFIILSCLIGVIYMMLDYQCATCSAKCDLNNITRNINEISHHIAVMKENYKELELKISKFSLELPKIEGQVEVLEALAGSLDCGSFGWEPKPHVCFPSNDVDTYLNHCAGDQPVKPSNVIPSKERYVDQPKRNLTKRSEDFPKHHKVKQVYSNSNIVPTF